MSTNPYSWKIWLRPNTLTPEVDNDYVAEVSTLGNTLHNQDIAKLIVAEGSEIKYDTLLSILNQADRIVLENVQQGRSIQTGYCHLMPRVTGTWIGSNARYDQKAHKITLDMTLSAEMREALKQVGVEILGVKEGISYIGLVTDGYTGKTDGTISVNEDLIIEGARLKIAPEDDDTLGVFFVAGDIAQKVTHRMLQNDPKKLIVRVPYLASGEYTLQVVTRFSSNSTLLKEPRTITYERKLTVAVIP
jgi:hypothetical protein